MPVSLILAVSLCCLMPLGLAWAAPPPPPPPRPAAPVIADNFAAEAAARHARRTACIKEARDKRLVGPNRNAYIKDCVGH